jgi:hypothetical protein
MDQRFSENPITLQLDPIWSNYSRQIRSCRNIFNKPLTLEGEKITQEVYQNLIFSVYNRLQPIFSGLINLVEAEEIFGKDFFKDKTRQRIILRAFGLLIEDQIKFEYSPDEKKYEEYRLFFEKFLSKLRSFDQQIEQGQQLPNFVNSLIMVTSQLINSLNGVENFSIKTDEIRRRIKEYLPQLNNVDGGKIVEEIKNRWQKALVIVENK